MREHSGTGAPGIVIRRIDKTREADVNLPNEPFRLFGRMVPSYINGQWSFEVIRYAPESVTEMTFPDERYTLEGMPESVFLGAYDGDACIGLAVLQPGSFKYMYLYDLKVCRAYRGRHVGRMLIDRAKKIALQRGYRGLYTQGQDNNPGACLFYLHAGFHIGGLDTNVYRHTKQAGKADIIFYLDCGE